MDQNVGPLPAGYPSDWEETVQLEDGTQVYLRPILPSDARRLQEGFLRLSPQSIYMRFLEALKQLSDEQARELATVDYHDRMAIVAEVEENGERQMVGVTRYALLPVEEPGLAEAAIVVGDEFQNRGLGTVMISRLVQYARQQGLRAFVATVQMSNARIMHFIKRSGLRAERKMIEPGVWDLHIYLNNSETTENGQA